MPKSQEQAILEYLQAGKSLTPLEGLELFGTMRLGARIFDLIQEGHNIKSEIVKGENNKHFAKYWLDSPKNASYNAQEAPSLPPSQGVVVCLTPKENATKELENVKNPAPLFATAEGQLEFIR